MSSLYKGKKSKSSQAYRLIHDPTRLFQLLYSKYGDIEEDYNVQYINFLLYNTNSHYLSLYKEYQYTYFIDEFLKRFYQYHEAIERIPKLSEYYKNYHLFFCRPIFRNCTLTDLLHNYGDIQAEIFYKNNYANDNNKSKNLKDDDSSNKNNDDNSLSSLDNITNNKTIFDKRTRLIIETIKDSKLITITLNSSRTANNNNNNNLLYSNRSKNNSFVKIVEGLINPQTNNKVYNNSNNHSNNKNEKLKGNKIKGSLCNLTKGKIEHFNSPSGGDTKILLSPKLRPYLTSFKSNIAEFNKNKPKINYNSNFNYNSIRPKNKTNYYNEGNIKCINKISKLSSSNIHNANKNSIMIITLNGNNRFSSSNIINGFFSSKSKKNKTYEFNINSTNNQLSSNASRSKGKKRTSSTLKQKTKKFTSLKLPFNSSSNRNKTNGQLHPSSSIPKYNSINNNNNPFSILTKTIQFTKSKSKEKNSTIIQKENISYSNMILNLKSKKYKTILQSQRLSNANKNNTSNGMKSPKQIGQNANDGIFNSRNKLNYQKSSMQLGRSGKHKRGNSGNIIISNSKTIMTKSVDEKGNGVNINRKESNREVSNRFMSQIEELKKISTFYNQGYGSHSTNMIFCNKKNTGNLTKGNGNGKGHYEVNGNNRVKAMCNINNVNANTGTHFKNDKKYSRVVSPKILD